MQFYISLLACTKNIELKEKKMKNFITKAEAQKHYVLKNISKTIKNRSLGTLYYDMFENGTTITDDRKFAYFQAQEALNS